jgi:aspartyl-tRNA(Asn)/glutamyl-tRNA(Gln) amidotransferase subunit B
MRAGSLGGARSGADEDRTTIQSEGDVDVAKDRLVEVLKDWEAVIGLEVHTELTSLNTKMFCGCPVAFGGEVNTRVCPVCLGMPGALPVPNEKAVEATVLAGLAMDCGISRFSQFHRKNYFYPDMPKDYQISQYDVPFCVGGHLDLELEGDGAAQRVHLDGTTSDGAGGYTTRIGITRIHLEEDTGKMIHVGGSEGRIAGATHSLVDFNRAGTGLMELVSEPDIRTPEEGRRFAQKLRLIFLTLGVSDCNMEEGSMRVDANVSVRKRGAAEFGVKAEVKNMNSFKALHDALAHEIVRQAELLEAGGTVEQETRHWDAGAKRTSSLRSKEYASDYRYFPEPDMVPFTFDDAYIESVRAQLPELPDARKARFMDAYGLPAHDATVLTGDLALAAFYEEAVAHASRALAKQVANWTLGEFSGYLNARGLEADETCVSPKALAQLARLIEDGTISGKQAKDVFAEMSKTGEEPAEIVERLGLKQVSDTAELEAVVDAVLAVNPGQVEQYRGGKTGLIGYFVGAVMRETKGQANPAVVNEVLARRLGA